MPSMGKNVKAWIKNVDTNFSEAMHNLTGVIDFEDVQLRPDENDNENKECEDEDDVISREINLNTTKNSHPLAYQYPLLASEKPPGGIPAQCLPDLWCQSMWYRRLRSAFLVSEYRPFQCGTLHGFLGLYHERFRHLKMYPYTIHPYSDFVTFWNYFVGLSVMISISYTPFIIAFIPGAFMSKEYICVNFLLASIVLADLVLNFFIGVRDKCTQNIILDPLEIVRRYMKRWFWYDLITRLPYDPILLSRMTPEEKNIRENLEAIRVLATIMRILRYRKIYIVLGRITETFAFRNAFIPWAMKLVVLILFIIHWLGCIHWLLPDIMDARLPKGIHKNLSWITVYDLWDAPVFEKYINAYLRSLSNVLTVDGGSFIPREPEEILCTIIGVFVSVSVIGYFISSFSSLTSRINASNQLYQRTYEIIARYLRFQNIPPYLQHKVLTYFQEKHKGHMFSDAAIMAILSPTLRSEIASHNCRNLISKVPMFKSVPAEILVQICEKLQYEVYIPTDVLAAPGTIGNDMFFILEGEVDVISPMGNKIDSLRDGDFFGELSLITATKRQKGIVARKPCQIYKISRKDFFETLAPYHEVYSKVILATQERLNKEKDMAEDIARRMEKIQNWKKTRILESLNEDDYNEIYESRKQY